MKALIGLFLFLVSLVVPGICIVKSIHFKQDCSGYLKQAADANTVELALDRVTLALNYIEARGLTKGYTSVIWRTEDENIGYWYQNIKACKEELEKGINGTQLEKANILMKVRETLTDNGSAGTILTIPDGIHKYPDNLMFGVMLWVSVLLFLIGSMFICVAAYEWSDELSYW